MYFGHSYISLSLIVGKRNEAIIHEAQHILFEVDQSFKKISSFTAFYHICIEWPIILGRS